MPENDTDVARAASRFHEEVPHRFQVSLTMSMDTRDSLRAVRDAVNEACDEGVFTTDDVIRLALRGTARHHAIATTDGSEPAATDDELLALSADVSSVLEADETVGESNKGG